jgi:hypothetical protein
MNFYILSVIIISALFIPVSFASADDFEFAKDTFEDKLGTPTSDAGKLYVFVQIIQRDSNGNLISFLQSDKMTHLNPNTTNYYLDERAKTVDMPVYDFDGVLVQAYGEEFSTEIKERDITASTLLVIEMVDGENPDGELVRAVAARFAHDGFVAEPGDVVDTYWYIARLLN